MKAYIDSATVPHGAPVQAHERIQILDILRGFALFGILLVNMELFANPLQIAVQPLEPSPYLVDRIAAWLVRLLAETKFYSLFSFLFGLGFALQLVRAEEKRVPFAPLYVRRLLALLGFGLLHAYLVWVGDILTLYAVLGFVLLLYRQAKPRTLLLWAGIWLLVPFLFIGATTLLVEAARATPEGAAAMHTMFATQRAEYRAATEHAYRVYATGDFLAITAQRAADIGFLLFSSLFLAPSVLGMFLIGFYVSRRRIFQALEANRPWFRRVLIWGLVIGLPGNLLFATLLSGSLSRVEPSPALVVATLGQTVGAPALAMFYVAALTLLYLRPAWRPWLSRLAPAGRMALTNYLAQSLICTLIFYGYGFGLFGQVGKAMGLVLAVIIYGIELVWSAWWLEHFEFGPAEWLWRSLTYWRWQPWHKRAPQVV